MGIREDLLALADELEGVSLKDDCESCLASCTELCRGDLECAESAHKACAKRLREIVEHDAGEVTTMSAYDLLPEEDRKAIAWVREHGGLDAVEKRWAGRIPRAHVENMAERQRERRERMQRHIEYIQRLCRERRERIGELNREIADMRPRLMPEGMEWPKVDGEPVDFVTGYEPSLGVLEAVSIYNNGACEVMSHDGIIKGVTDIHIAKPKALDADGVEICVGDRLYDTDTGCGRTVRAVNDNGTVEFDGHENRGWFGCFLTHRAPVLAADGEPLDVGQTVWDVGNGVEFTVVGLPNPGEYQSVKLRIDDGAFTGLDPDRLTHQRPVLDADGVPIRELDTVWNATTSAGPFTVREIKRSDDPDEPEDIVWCGEHAANGFKVWRIADQLTHTKPEIDSWERIEEDAKLWPGEYAQGHPGWAEHDGRLSEFMALDLVRRCRALAEKGER